MSTDYPDDLRYTKEHEWARIEGKIATVGITEFAVESLGDITLVELPKEGEKFKREEVAATIESVKAVSDIFAPLSGTIHRVNDPLGDQPENLNADCYDEGWLFQIEIANPKELDELMTSSQYAEYLKDNG